MQLTLKGNPPVWWPRNHTYRLGWATQLEFLAVAWHDESVPIHMGYFLRLAVGRAGVSWAPDGSQDIWVVADETEARWLGEWFRMMRPRRWRDAAQMACDDVDWEIIRRMTAPSIGVIIDPMQKPVDLEDLAEHVQGTCKICGMETSGTAENSDPVTAAEWERLQTPEARSGWWCSECYEGRCLDCQQALATDAEDDLCDECRAATTEEDSPT